MRTPPRQQAARRFRFSPMIAAFACAFGTHTALGATFTVNVGGDPVELAMGQLSLRYAISQANAACASAPHTINFSGGPFTIAPSTELPAIACAAVTIQGPGAGSVAIDGSSMFSPGCGLTASSASTKISGLTVRNFSYGGASYGLCGTMEASGNTVHGNTKGFYLNGGSILSGNEVFGNVYGVYDNGNGLTLSSNTIRNNSAIGVVAVDGVAITNGNLVHSNGQTGISVGNSALVTGNTVYSNGGEGITVGSAAVLRGNTVHGHLGGTGIYMTGVGTVGGPLAADRNVIYGNSTGIYTGGGTIQNNYIGVTADGNTAAGNGDGILSYSAPTLTIADNVISGNSFNGVILYDIGTLLIQGNKVGTNAAGSAALGNGGSGISAYFSYGGQIVDNVVAANTGGGINLGDVNLTISNNQVGGAGAFQNGASALEIDWAAGGLVSGNMLSGSANCGITASGLSNVSITGNKIGTDASGTTGIANGVCGIDLYNSSSVSISGNQISANGFYGGVVLDSVSGVTLQGNLIGTASDGVSALSNNGPGVTISGFASPPASSSTDLQPKAAKILGAGNTLVDNVIAHNNGDGVKLITGTTNHAITGSVSGQSIHSNNGKNINLDFAGAPRPNDNPDGTVPGPNNGQNRPAITSVVEDSGSTVIQGSLQSFAQGIFINDLPFNGQFEIDLYGNDVPGVPAGKTWLGKTTATTNASGTATFTATIAGTGFGHITATATGPFGTSEFSDTLLALVPAASITPMSVSFGNVVVGATMTTATEVAFRSNGTGNYVIDSISQGATAPACPGTSSPVCATGDFSCSVSCTTGTLYPPLAPLAAPSCKISGLSFHPSAAGAQSSTLWVCDNTSATARAISFTGTGVPHVVTVSQSAHDFGNVSIGTQMTSPSILVTNGSGNPPAMLGAPAVAAPFSVGSNTCTSSLAPGASCNFTVVYAPTVIGPSTGTFTMTVANGSPVVVNLQGAGISTAVGQLPLPAGIDFGTAVLASAPLQHALTLQNTGNGPVNFGAITVTAPFQMAHNCPASLAPAASCTVNLAFDPLIYGNSTGQLSVSSDAGSGNQVVTLLATVAGVGYSLSPWDHAFGGVAVGTTSTARAIAVSNNGANAIPLSGFAVTGPFTIVSNDCGASLAPASFCTAQLAFAPVAQGPAEGTFTAQVGLTGAPPAVATLSGTGTQQAALALPGAIDFGAILRGSVPSVSQPVELRNTGNATLTFSTGINGPFALSGNCGTSLAPGAACTLLITFVPSTVGDFAGSLDISSNAPGGSGSIPIAARVQAQPRADVRVDVSEMGFGDRMIGTRSGPQRVTISNVGLVAAQLGVLPPARDFITASQCGATLAPGASCTADVVFMPMATGLRYNRLQFTSDAPGSPFGVDLSGRGCSPPRPGRPPSCD